MRCIDLIASFELEINKLDDSINKPVTDDSLYWINQAVAKFVKERFNGAPPKRTSYEQTEKRTSDLVNLLKEETNFTPSINDTHPSYTSYEYTYPSDMLYVLNEDVIISNNNDEY